MLSSTLETADVAIHPFSWVGRGVAHAGVVAGAQEMIPVEAWTAVGGFLLAMLFQWVASAIRVSSHAAHWLPAPSFKSCNKFIAL